MERLLYLFLLRLSILSDRFDIGRICFWDDEFGV
jgi:hypothetical protein